MPAPDLLADKAMVIEAVVLAFSRSDARLLVGTDALRGVLDIEYRDLVSSGSFDLQQVWELLEEQPGFDPLAVTPPLCLFKSWEDKLGVAITLPDSLAGLAPKIVALEAAKCRVAPSELQAVLRRKRGARPTRPPVRELSSPAKSGSGKWAALRASPIALGGAAVVALACFLFVGLTLHKACAGPDWKGMSTADFTEIPVATARRLGAQVELHLSDPNWMQLPAETRKQQLEQALRRLEAKDIDSLYIQSADGQVIATALFYDQKQKIRVNFP